MALDKAKLKAVLEQDQGDDREGKLPESFRLKLKDIFGCPFETVGVLGRIGMD